MKLKPEKKEEKVQEMYETTLCYAAQNNRAQSIKQAAISQARPPNVKP